LHPPPKSPFTGTFFRLFHAVLLVVIGWFSGYLLPQMLLKLTESARHANKNAKSN